MVSLSYEKVRTYAQDWGRGIGKTCCIVSGCTIGKGRIGGIFFTLRLYLNPIDVKIPKIV